MSTKRLQCPVKWMDRTVCSQPKPDTNPNERRRSGKQSEPSSGLFSLFGLAGTAAAPRYFKSLASSSGSKPEAATATTGAKRDCRSEQVSAVEKNTGQNRMVDFTLESLLEFQHSQRVASAETGHPATHDFSESDQAMTAVPKCLNFCCRDARGQRH